MFVLFLLWNIHTLFSTHRISNTTLYYNHLIHHNFPHYKTNDIDIVNFINTILLHYNLNHIIY